MVRLSRTRYILNPLKLARCDLSQNLGANFFYSAPSLYNAAGTQIQTRAWTHANARVVEHITHMVTMSDYCQQFLELRFTDRLSVADAVVLEHRLGLMQAANFVAEVDPWCYPHDDSPALIGVKSRVQVLSQATHPMRQDHYRHSRMQASQTFSFLLFS